MSLTEEEIKLIEDTWSLAKDLGLQKAGTVMFMKLFEIAPDLQELFSFHDEEVSEENESLKKHAVQVMESVGMAIGLLHDPEKLVSTLTELGIVHHLLQVQLDSFGPVGEALIYALQVLLKDKFTLEVKAAWVKLYGAVQHYMELGMKEGLEADT